MEQPLHIQLMSGLQSGICILSDLIQSINSKPKPSLNSKHLRASHREEEHHKKLNKGSNNSQLKLEGSLKFTTQILMLSRSKRPSIRNVDAIDLDNKFVTSTRKDT